MSNIKHLNDNNFHEVVFESELPVLVDFWGESCQPCLMLNPIVDRIAKDNAGKVLVVKVNVEENIETPDQFGIRGVPTLLLFKNGKVVDKRNGMVSKSSIDKMLRKALKGKK
jgi:thioredoxin 1